MKFSERDFIMTRKTALKQAIYILSRDNRNKEICEKIQELMDELPIIHWSDKSIRDRVEQFIEDEGRIPTVTDFRRAGMPPHPVIKQKYKITLSEWLNQNYPVQKPTFEELKLKYTNEFIKDYNKIQPRSSSEFNEKRTDGTKGWQTVASYYNVSSWRKLIYALNLTPHFELYRERIRPKLKVNISHDISFK